MPKWYIWLLEAKFPQLRFKSFVKEKRLIKIAKRNKKFHQLTDANFSKNHYTFG